MKWSLQFKSIKTQLIFWFLIIGILPVVISISIIYFQRIENIKHQTNEKLEAIRDLKVLQIENWLTERTNDLKIMTLAPKLKEINVVVNNKLNPQENAVKIESIREALNNFLKGTTSYKELFIINPKTGVIEVSTDVEFEGQNKSGDDYFVNPFKTNDNYIKDIYFSEKTNEFEMTFSIPIFGDDVQKNEVVGIFVARINLDDTLYKILLNRTGLGATGETLLVNKEALALNELRWIEDAPLKLKIKADPALEAAKGNVGTGEAVDYRGEAVIVSYSHIPQMGWGFVAKQDQAEVYKPIQALLKDLIWLTLISIVLIGIFAYVFANLFSRRIKAIAKVSTKIIKGDFSARNKITGNDEITLLAKAINQSSDVVSERLAVRHNFSEISKSIVGHQLLETFTGELLKSLAQITNAEVSVFYQYDEETKKYVAINSIGAQKSLLTNFDADSAEGELGMVLVQKEMNHLKDIPSNTQFTFKTSIGDVIPKEILTIPILENDQVVAVISLATINSFSNPIMEVLKIASGSINTSYANIIASVKTKKLATDLEITNVNLEQQSNELQAQAEELQIQTTELQSISEELQQQNYTLEQKSREVEEANRLKSEFLSNMSHELRTPLNSVLALSNILRLQTTDRLTTEELSYLEIIERNGKNLLQLINDILDLSKIEAGKLDLYPTKLHTKNVINEVIYSLKPLANKKQLLLNWKADSNLAEIETDETRLKQIITNVLNNAIKFTEKGSVTVNARTDQQQLYIEIIDTGIGISEEYLHSIFEKFRQIDGTASRHFEGTGLGLAIVSELTNKLNGDIKVQSKLGEGTTFEIILPLKWSEDKEHDFKPDYVLNAPKSSLKKEVLNQDNGVPLIPNKDKLSDGNGKRILIVEDNESAILQVKYVLEQQGYLVDVAIGGDEALEYMKYSIPDGIILDLMMPGMNGFELLAIMRKNPKTTDIPVLVLTAKILSKAEIMELNNFKVQQLVQKGDIDVNHLLALISIMVSNESIKTVVENKVLIEKSVLKSKKALPNQKLKVLIIEDNPDNMTTIKALLGNKFELFEAYDGDEGIAVTHQVKPDLILLDVLMPIKDGLTVARELKADAATKDIPIIAVTAKAMKEDKEAIFEAGFDGYTTKPLNESDLFAEINKFFEKTPID